MPFGKDNMAGGGRGWAVINTPLKRRSCLAETTSNGWAFNETRVCEASERGDVTCDFFTVANIPIRLHKRPSGLIKGKKIAS